MPRKIGQRGRPVAAVMPSTRRSGERHGPGVERDRRAWSASAGGLTVALRRRACRRGRRAGARGRPSGRPSNQTSMRSSSSRPASRRRSWMARVSSRASPSASSAGVSAVSSTTTRPSRSATAVPGRGVAWISTSSAARVSPGQRHRAVVVERDRPLARGGHDRRDGRPEPLADLRQERLDPPLDELRAVGDDDRPACTLTSSANRRSSPSSRSTPRSGTASHARASGWRTRRPACARRVRARSTAPRSVAIEASSAVVAERRPSRPPASASGGRCRAGSGRPTR